MVDSSRFNIAGSKADRRHRKIISSGESTCPKNFSDRIFHKLLEKAGLRHVRFHDLRHTFAPDAAGTLITGDTPSHQYSVKTVTSITGMTLVSVEGRGMIGVPGVAGRVFTTTARHRISVLMFSQGSSEQHISLVVSRHDGEQTVKALRREFEGEIERRRIDRVSLISEIAIIALVGEGIKGAPGVAARAFGTLGAAAINIMMIAQGSSELNLSIVVRETDAPRAVRLLHDAFELGSGM